MGARRSPPSSKGHKYPWVTLTPCGPSLGFPASPSLYQLGPGWDAGDAATPPRAGTQPTTRPARLPESPHVKGSYLATCCLRAHEGPAASRENPASRFRLLRPGLESSRGQPRPPAPRQHPPASAPLAAAPLADARSGPPCQSRPGAELRAPPDVSCLLPGPTRLWTEPPRPLAARPGGRPSHGSRCWEVEGRDYDTFPEKPPPSPGERTRVG